MGSMGMHARLTPIRRKHLADPAACGVRLGIELREAAEREAYALGMCLSHWIKKVVEEAVSISNRKNSASVPDIRRLGGSLEDSSVKSQLNTAFEQEMEKLNDR
jgi:hypothetical protein